VVAFAAFRVGFLLPEAARDENVRASFACCDGLAGVRLIFGRPTGVFSKQGRRQCGNFSCGQFLLGQKTTERGSSDESREVGAISFAPHKPKISNTYG
jgi:hypothetical protein